MQNVLTDNHWIHGKHSFQCHIPTCPKVTTHPNPGPLLSSSMKPTFVPWWGQRSRALVVRSEDRAPAIPATDPREQEADQHQGRDSVRNWFQIRFLRIMSRIITIIIVIVVIPCNYPGLINSNLWSTLRSSDERCQVTLKCHYFPPAPFIQGDYSSSEALINPLNSPRKQISVGVIRTESKRDIYPTGSVVAVL